MQSPQSPRVLRLNVLLPAKPSSEHLRPCHYFVRLCYCPRTQMLTWWLETWPCVHILSPATLQEMVSPNIMNQLAQQHVFFFYLVVCSHDHARHLLQLFISDCAAYVVAPYHAFSLPAVWSHPCCIFLRVYRRLLTINYSDVLCTKRSFKAVPVCHHFCPHRDFRVQADLCIPSSRYR